MIIVNGEPISGLTEKSISELIALRGYGEKQVVAELNGEIIKGSERPKVKLKDGDVVEILRFMGGG
ncbi:MAG: sulfur carrier protein ThiS [Clostridiales bacterium]|jgi:thiamine biosynthesis protein ThiS|nr:sulfur carrier protein ThiS [Clostridiales bacterium]